MTEEQQGLPPIPREDPAEQYKPENEVQTEPVDAGPPVDTPSDEAIRQKDMPEGDPSRDA